MKIIIDRIEGNTVYAELPDLSIIKIPVEIFEDAKEGSCYIIEKTDNPQSDNIKNLMDEVF